MAALALATMAATVVQAEDKPLGVQIVDQMNALYGVHPGTRANHATGFVFEGLFTPAAGADELSSAIFLKGAPTPLTIRFSNSGGVPNAPDADPSVGGIRGMAVKFHQADGGETDLVCISAHTFPVATGDDFLLLLQAIGASGPGVAKPTPIERFLATHPAALAFVLTPRPVAVSYGTQTYFGVDAFKFTNAKGKVTFGRYRIVPTLGEAFVSVEEAAKRAPNALADVLHAEVAKAPVKFTLQVQVAAAGDPIGDATKAWPDSRPFVTLGEIAVTKALDTKQVENQLLFTPTNLPDGIEASDDPLIDLRGEAYAVSFGRRAK
jgi:catalase